MVKALMFNQVIRFVDGPDTLTVYVYVSRELSPEQRDAYVQKAVRDETRQRTLERLRGGP